MGAGSVVTCSVVHEPPSQKVSVVTIGAGLIVNEIVSVTVFETPSDGDAGVTSAIYRGENIV
jgi:hypothetical protein